MNSLTRIIAFIILIAGLRAAETPVRESDRDGMLWPQFRHDSGLTATSPLTGGLAQAPEELWRFDLGATLQPAETVRLEDLNGDGHVELLRVLSDRLICQDLRGATLWEVTGLAHPAVTDVRDWTGNGVLGVRVLCNDGVKLEHYMVNGATGASVLLFTQQDIFGGYERAGHILRDVPGQQLCVWWDGEDPENRNFNGDNMRGDGYLWSFENGPDQPTQRFHARATGTVYAGQHLFADADGDGQDEFVMIAHQQMWLFNPETGEQKGYLQWQPQIRSYRSLLALAPLNEGEPPAQLEINYMIPGVQVIQQDGHRATRLWKAVVAPKEDQYQVAVKVGAAAPDPFIDMDGDGVPEILATVTNEHGDGKVCLVIFDARTGNRLYDQPIPVSAEQAGIPTGQGPNGNILTVDDLDGDGRLEFLFQEGDLLKIANWNGSGFVERWSGAGVAPLLQPAPPEGRLDRCTLVGYNCPLWRETADSSAFLLRFPDGVFSCELARDGGVEQLRPVTTHDALGNGPSARQILDSYTWDGRTLVAREDDREVWRYEVPLRRVYSSPSAIVADLAGRTRILTRSSTGTLLSLAGDGGDPRALLEHHPASIGVDCSSLSGIEPPLVADLEGDGENEVIATATVDGTPCTLIMDGSGRVKRRIDPIPTTTQILLGVTGRLGPGQGRWLVIRYTRQAEREAVVAYNGTTGETLWMRDSYTDAAEPYKFVLWLPTSVWDADGDGADELISYSANHYGLIRIRDGSDLFPLVKITAAFPGHWPAYGTPVLADFTGADRPDIFLSRSYSMVCGATLEGAPIWHYGFRRSEGPNRHGVAADLDGDGRDEVVYAQQDGLVRAFSGVPHDATCPACPPDVAPAPANRAGEPLWSMQLRAPVSDMAAADLDGDGRLEVLLGAGDGKLYALEHNGDAGRVLWSVALSDQPVGGPILADLSGTGQPSILVPTDDGYLHCLSASR